MVISDFYFFFTSMQTHYPELGMLIPEIYLPKSTIDRNKRSVVACDQYTSQPEYRAAVAEYVGDQPSTLHFICPEVYLAENNTEQRIANIQQTMQDYVQQGILENKGTGLIFLDRQTIHAPSRKGLIIALDLEQYDYNKGSQTLIRATEGTVVDRLPPRIKIRQGALLESPHIMVLIDDPTKQVIEPLAEHLETYEQLYDFDLMMDGGHIKGYHITDETSIQHVVNGLKKLIGDEAFPLLLAMGDGNHSFATAKAIWEEKKKSLTATEQATHPARFVLVELNNIHDDGITFAPIHRVLFNVDATTFFREAKEHFAALGSELEIQQREKDETDEREKKTVNPTVHTFQAINADGFYCCTLHHPQLSLEVGSLQRFLDEYLAMHPETTIDYVHGTDITKSLGVQS
jgi:hypothetical protein